MFEYFGNIRRVRNEIEEWRGRLTDTYGHVLGDRFEMVERMSEALLVPCPKPEPGGGAKLAEDNSFFYVGFDFKKDVKVKSDGRIQRNKVIARPYIHLSRVGIELAAQSEMYGGLPEHLVLFLHEYNHFIIFCLQECPDMLAGFIGWEKAKEYGPIDQMNPLKNLSPGQFRWMQIYAHHFEVFETTQHFLSALVFDNLGFDTRKITDNPHMQKHFSKYGLHDEESLFDFVSHWNTRIQYVNSFQRNFFRTLENVVVEKRPMP